MQTATENREQVWQQAADHCSEKKQVTGKRQRLLTVDMRQHSKPLVAESKQMTAGRAPGLAAGRTPDLAAGRAASRTRQGIRLGIS